MLSKSRLTIALSVISLVIVAGIAYLSTHRSSSATASDGAADTAKILKELETSAKYINDVRSGDSSVLYLKRALDAIESGKETLSYSMCIKIADKFSEGNNYAAAIEYYTAALSRLDHQTSSDSKDGIRNYMEIYSKIAYCLRAYNPTQSAVYLHKSLNEAEKLYAADSSFNINKERFQTLNSLGSLYLDNDRFDSTRIYWRKAAAYCSPTDPEQLTKRYNNLGILSAEEGNIDKAEEYFTRALALAKQQTPPKMQSHIYINLGKCRYLTGRYSDACRYLLEACNAARNEKNLKNNLSAEESLATIYEKMHDNTAALTHLRQAYALKDSFLDGEKIVSSIQADLRYQYQKQKDEALLRQDLESTKRERNAQLVIFVCIIIIAAGAVTLYLQRMRARQSRLQQEALALRNENLSLRAEKLEEKLDATERELSEKETELINKHKEVNAHSEYLLNRKNFVSDLMGKIDMSSVAGDTNEMDEILRDIQANIKNSFRDEFSILFQNLHSDFYKNIYTRHGNLTPNEKRLCAFIRLNMSSKEISAVTGQSVKSIEIARSRLRTKLGLNRRDNLNAYLQQF